MYTDLAGSSCRHEDSTKDIKLTRRVHKRQQKANVDGPNITKSNLPSDGTRRRKTQTTNQGRCWMERKARSREKN